MDVGILMLALVGVVFAVIGLAAGAAVASAFLKPRIAAAELAGRQASAAALAQWQERGRALEASARVDRLELQQLRAEGDELRSALAAAEARLAAEREGALEKLAVLGEAREDLVHQFQALANRVLEEKSQRFTEQNKQGLAALLEPLQTQLKDFKGKVEEVYVNEAKDRSALKEQVQQLLGLNHQLSQDAHDLTRALKGNNKTQGTWGELVLERVLEQAGLRRGLEFDVQACHTSAAGTRQQPDVVLHLPDDKHLVVDSKVSLVAWEAMVNAADDEARDLAAGKHLDSLRSHVKGLSAKNYQHLHGAGGLDFVLLFVPIEPAWLLATQRDPQLWQDAWAHNVLLVSPSTLLFVVRTVAQLWRQELQSRNAQEIARRGADLYDKLVGFVSDLDDVGARLDAAQDAWLEARKKLGEGRGNVIRQAELLKELGVKPSKSLPPKVVAAALDAAG